MGSITTRRLKQIVAFVGFIGMFVIAVMSLGGGSRDLLYSIKPKVNQIPVRRVIEEIFKEKAETQMNSNSKQRKTTIAESSEEIAQLPEMSPSSKLGSVQLHEEKSAHKYQSKGIQKSDSDFEVHNLINRTKVKIQQRQTNLTNIFTKDYIPPEYETTHVTGTIHICGISATKKTVSEVRIFVKSVLLHARRSNIVFHFVVFEGSEETLPAVFEEIKHPFVNVSYELVYVDLNEYVGEKMAKQKFRNTHFRSGIYGMAKCFIYDFFKNVDKCIVLDTDVLFAVDPAFLWSEVQLHLRPPVLMAITWRTGDRYFNSGVMLQDFAAMRKVDFGNLYSMKHCSKTGKEGNFTYNCYGDQTLLNGVKKDHNEFFSNFTASWNLGICFGFRKFPFTSFKDENLGLFFGLAHFTCLPETFENAFVALKSTTRKGVRTGLIGYIEDLIAMDYNNLDGTGHVEKI